MDKIEYSGEIDSRKGGDVVFQSGVGRDRGHAGDLIFQVGAEEAFRIKGDGTFWVKGVQVEDARDLYGKFAVWLDRSVSAFEKTAVVIGEAAPATIRKYSLALEKIASCRCQTDLQHCECVVCVARNALR